MESAKSFEAKFKRILEAAGVARDADLARVLGIKPPSVAAARKRQQIPTGWVEKIAENHDINANWLFFGEGHKHRSTKNTEKPTKQDDKLDAGLLETVIEVVEEVLEDSGRELPPKQKAQLVVAIYDLYQDSEKTLDKSSVLRLVKSVA